MFRKMTLALALVAGILFAVPAAAQLQGSATAPHGALAARALPGSPTTGRSTNRPIGHLWVKHFRQGKLLGGRDLGTGNVTNVGVDMWANDSTWIAAATPFSALSSFNYVSTGTGVTAMATADFWLQTQGTHFSAGTNGYYTGAISITAPNVWKNVATVTYNGTEAVTEYILAMSNAAISARTSSGTPTATTLPDSGAAFTTSGNGLKGFTVEAGSLTSINTPTSTVAGLITSNTATQLNIANGWWTLANASGSTPGVNTTYNVQPTILDHKTFAAINVVNGDSIQFTYSLTLVAGG